MPFRPLPSALMLTAALALAGCGSSPSPSASPSGAIGTAPPSPGVETSSESPSAEGGSADSNNPYAAPEMAALLPASVEGVAFEVSSFDYSAIPLAQAAGSFGYDGDMEDWLTEHGKSWSDVRLATAVAVGDKSATIIALRVKGVDAPSLKDWFGTSGADLAGGEGERVTLGGKAVSRYAMPGGMTMVVYSWQAGDTIYWGIAEPGDFGDKVMAAVK